MLKKEGVQNISARDRKMWHLYEVSAALEKAIDDHLINLSCGSTGSNQFMHSILFAMNRRPTDFEAHTTKSSRTKRD